MRAVRLVVFSLIVVGVGSSCGSDGAPGAENEPVVSPKARVLDEATRSALVALEGADGETLRFTAGAGDVDAIAVDQILVSEPCTAAPLGLLRRVVAVHEASSGPLARPTRGAWFPMVRTLTSTRSPTAMAGSASSVSDAT